MTDPKRWLEDSSFASSLEHELVLSGKRLGPPEGAAARSWAELAPLLGPGPGPGSSGGSEPSGSNGTGLEGASGPLSLGTGASSLGAGTIKAFVVGAALGVAVMGGVQAAREPHRVPSVALAPPPPPPRLVRPAEGAGPALHGATDLPPQARSPEETPRSAPVTVEPAPALAPPRAPAVKEAAARVEAQTALEGAVAAPAPSASVAPPPARAEPEAVASATPEGDGRSSATAPSAGAPRSANWLRAEAQEMARARNFLGSGRANEALLLLQNAADRFAGGALMQEREALIVEALFGSGRTEQGRARARAFVQKYPNSPMSERMRRLERGAP